MKKATRSAKSTTAPKAAAKAGGEKAARPPKQAVVIIHGMGEQRPMETLRDFVRAVWMEDHEFCRVCEQDPNNGSWKVVDPEEKENRVLRKSLGRGTWVTPVSGGHALEGAAHENIRITTDFHEHGPSGGAQSLRTDFYELYWADIAHGDALSLLRRWAIGLFLRPFRRVPHDVFSLWLGLWFLVLVVAFLLFLGYPQFLPFGTSKFAEIGDSATKALAKLVTGTWLVEPSAWLVVVGFVCVCVAARAWLEERGLKPGDLRATRLLNVVAWQLGAFLCAAAIIWLIAWLGRTFSKGEGELAVVVSVISIVAFGLAGAIVFAVNYFIVPYFGDVARYVQTATDTVQHREEIRRRGLTLLKALHEDDSYGRVVIASHSLGTVVAYDLIRLFWGQYGATAAAHCPLEIPAQTALLQVARSGAKHDKWQEWSFQDIRNYRELQKAAFSCLFDQQWAKRHSDKRQRVWKISDFVTFGSPLTHADFLIARDEEGFRALERERTLPVNPPLPEEGANQFPRGEKSSFMYSSEHDGVSQVTCHHAAPFAVVRWTNIYDWRRLGIFGDFVSGPLRHHFGSGILDFHVNMRRESRRFFPNRLVTHTLYWTQWSADEWGKIRNWVTGNHSRRAVTSVLSGNGAIQTKGYPGDDPIHIRLLRAACDLQFGDDVVADAKLMSGQENGASIRLITGELRDQSKGELLRGFFPIIFRGLVLVLLLAAAAAILFPEWLKSIVGTFAR